MRERIGKGVAIDPSPNTQRYPIRERIAPGARKISSYTKIPLLTHTHAHREREREREREILPSILPSFLPSFICLSIDPPAPRVFVSPTIVTARRPGR
jgi:hypothetical protein